jgi:hypothetical protein
VIEYFKTTKMNAFGWLLTFDEKGHHIELGRRQPMYLAAAAPEENDVKGFRVHDQITIRTVRLPIRLRNRGVLSLLVSCSLCLPGSSASLRAEPT